MDRKVLGEVGSVEKGWGPPDGVEKRSGTLSRQEHHHGDGGSRAVDLEVVFWGGARVERCNVGRRVSAVGVDGCTESVVCTTRCLLTEGGLRHWWVREGDGRTREILESSPSLGCTEEKPLPPDRTLNFVRTSRSSIPQTDVSVEHSSVLLWL